jgi:hypothetical protein
MPAIVKDIKSAWNDQVMQKSKAESRSERERRLARALRDNIKRRKEQGRKRQASEVKEAAEGVKKPHQ